MNTVDYLTEEVRKVMIQDFGGSYIPEDVIAFARIIEKHSIDQAYLQGRMDALKEMKELI
jgi:hypothetical protein